MLKRALITRSLAVLSVALLCGVVLCGCRIYPKTKKSMENLPRLEIAVEFMPSLLDKGMVDGKNGIVFAVTPEEKAKYILRTNWRKKEQSV